MFFFARVFWSRAYGVWPNRTEPHIVHHKFIFHNPQFTLVRVLLLQWKCGRLDRLECGYTFSKMKKTHIQARMPAMHMNQREDT